jgi:Holliday junction resolvase
VEALEARGFHVDRLSGAGIPDLLVSKHGSMWLIEVKTAKGKLKPSQLAWREAFKGPKPWTLRTVEDALRFPEVESEA